MAKINNSLQSNYNSYEDKKIKNLSFSKGEIFSGRVMAKGQNSGDVILRIGEKWQVKASVKNSSTVDEGNYKFKVVGYENDKLQLEVVDEKTESSGNKQTQLDELVKEFGLKDEDKAILLEFVKEGVSLTKGTINDAKNMLHLSEKLKSGEVDIDNLISKFLEGKGIDLSSERGRQLTGSIKNALLNIKNLSSEEILFMIENNLDFTAEGIESLKDILGKDNIVFKNLQEMINVSSVMSLEAVMNKEILTNLDLRINSLLEKFNLTKVDLLNRDKLDPEFLKELATILKDSNGNNMQSLTKIFGNNEELFKNLEGMLKEGALQNNLKSQNDLQNSANISKELNPANVLKNLNVEASKENLQTAEMINTLKEMVKNKDINAITSVKLMEAGIDENSQEGQGVFKDYSNVLKDLNNESLKDILGELFSKPKELPGNIAFLKGMEEDLKNLLLKEDFSLKGDNLKVNNNLVDEAPDNSGKEIKNLDNKNIIDILKDFKIKVSKENVELVEIFKQYKEMVQNKDVESIAYKQLQNSGVNPDSKEGQSFLKDLSNLLNDIKSSPIQKLISSVSNLKDEEVKNTLNFLKEIKTSILTKETAMASSRAINVKEDITSKLNLMKEMITSLASKETTPLEFLNMFKGAISNFKVFNELSGNYYMVDVPINWNQKEAGCKLIVKDDRKSGKRIDSSNIKLVATVNTINMGDVDAYIKVSDKNMFLELKTEERFTKVFEKSKDIVKSSLIKMGYKPIVSVSKRIVEADLVNTKEFFEENNSIGINTRV